MKVVKDENYYHIQKNDSPHKWQVGEKHFIGFENNYFVKTFENAWFIYEIKSGNRLHINQSLQQIKALSNKKTISSIELKKIGELVNVPKLFLSDTLKTHRENIFEEIRLNFFPNLPSRKRGIWLIPFNSNSLKYWQGIMSPGKTFQIKATGKVHNSSEKHLRLENYNSLNYIRQAAFSYWAGVDEETDKDEIIFEGFIEIVKQIS